MKKHILFILLLLVPFIVKAQDVKIKDISLVDSTTDLEVEEHPEFKDLNINFDLKFRNIHDFIKYKVTVENTSKKDYEIDDTTEFSDGEFIKYEFTYDNDNVIKAGKEKEFYITITYNKEIPDDRYDNGKYVEKNNMTINLSEGDSSSTEQNPYTSTLPYIVIILEVVALICLIIAYKKKKSLMILLIAPLFIPLTIYALEKISINIEANIEVEYTNSTMLFRWCEHDSNGENNYELSIEYQKGMTWEEFFDSEYYDNIDSADALRRLEIDNNFFNYYSNEYDSCKADIVWPKPEDFDSPDDYEAAYDIARQLSNDCFDEYASKISDSNEAIKSDKEGYYYNYAGCVK